MFRRNILGVSWLREIRRQNVVPVHQKRTLEHVLELGERLLVAKVDHGRTPNEIGNSARNLELRAELAAVRVDFGGLFHTVLVATQLVGLGEFRCLVPGPSYLEERCFFKDASHSMVDLASI